MKKEQIFMVSVMSVASAFLASCGSFAMLNGFLFDFSLQLQS